LVELLVVIAIIGILATLLILQLGVARQRARDAQRIAHVNQIRTALEFAFDADGTYPDAISDATIGSYMAGGKVPVDPTTKAAYHYKQIDTTQYHLGAELEQKATALNSDLDYSSTGGFDGADADCGTENYVPADCIYDVGQIN